MGPGGGFRPSPPPQRAPTGTPPAQTRQTFAPAPQGHDTRVGLRSGESSAAGGDSAARFEGAWGRADLCRGRPSSPVRPDGLGTGSSRAGSHPCVRHARRTRQGGLEIYCSGQKGREGACAGPWERPTCARVMMRLPRARTSSRRVPTWQAVTPASKEGTATLK